MIAVVACQRRLQARRLLDLGRQGAYGVGTAGRLHRDVRRFGDDAAHPLRMTGRGQQRDGRAVAVTYQAVCSMDSASSSATRSATSRSR